MAGDEERRSRSVFEEGEERLRESRELLDELDELVTRRDEPEGEEAPP